MSNLEDARRQIAQLREQRRHPPAPVHKAPSAVEDAPPSPVEDVLEVEASIPAFDEEAAGAVEDPEPSVNDEQQQPAAEVPRVPEAD